MPEEKKCDHQWVLDRATLNHDPETGMHYLPEPIYVCAHCFAVRNEKEEMNEIYTVRTA